MHVSRHKSLFVLSYKVLFMMKILFLASLGAIAVPTHLQNTPLAHTPWANILNINRAAEKEPRRWYGEATFSADRPLQSLWVNIMLDPKALDDGEDPTQDNEDVKAESSETKNVFKQAISVSFFGEHNPLHKPPKLQATIGFNGNHLRKTNPHLVSRPDQDSQSVNTISEVTSRPHSTQPTVTRAEDRPQTITLQNNMLNTEEPVDMRFSEGSKPTSDDDEPGNWNNWTDGSSSSNKNGSRSSQPQCGKVTQNNPVPLVVNGTPTLAGQWPWQIALYRSKNVHDYYICGGTLVSRKHVITAAHCTTRKGSSKKVNENMLTVYLGKDKLRTLMDGVQIRYVDRIIVHPEYNASVFSQDLAILQLKGAVVYTDRVRPACLWPDNQIELSYIVGKKGSVVGWGFKDTGEVAEELSLVEMPVVDQETCLRSYSDFFLKLVTEFTYCAGVRDGTSVCNGDTGSGMVFKLEGSWYLRGVVSVVVIRENEFHCDSSHYVIFTDLAKFLPWIRQHVDHY